MGLLTFCLLELAGCKEKVQIRSLLKSSCWESKNWNSCAEQDSKDRESTVNVIEDTNQV